MLVTVMCHKKNHLLVDLVSLFKVLLCISQTTKWSLKAECEYETSSLFVSNLHMYFIVYYLALLLIYPWSS